MNDHLKLAWLGTDAALKHLAVIEYMLRVDDRLGALERTGRVRAELGKVALALSDADVERGDAPKPPAYMTEPPRPVTTHVAVDAGTGHFPLMDDCTVAQWSAASRRFLAGRDVSA